MYKLLVAWKKCRNFAPFSGMRGSERVPHFILIRHLLRHYKATCEGVGVHTLYIYDRQKRR